MGKKYTFPLASGFVQTDVWVSITSINQKVQMIKGQDGGMTEMAEKLKIDEWRLKPHTVLLTDAEWKFLKESRITYDVPTRSEVLRLLIDKEIADDENPQLKQED